MILNVFSVIPTILAQASQPATSGPTVIPPGIWPFVVQLGAALALGIAAIGSALGIGIAGKAAAGAWLKEAKAGQTLRFTHIILLGLPISQTLYAMIVMNKIRDLIEGKPDVAIQRAGLLLMVGIATGLAEMFSAWMQGHIGAAGIRSVSDSDGKGFAFVLIAMGIVETVGIFAMVFLLGLVPSV